MATNRPHPLLSIAIAAAVAVVCAIASTAASAQTWTYKSYKKAGMGGQYDKERFVMGTIALEEKDGKAYFSMNAGTTDQCLRGSIPAAVTKSDATTIIEPQPALAGCEKIRYVIRNDGSGGERQVWRGEAWKDDRFDHELKPAK
jgi:hypothetical protein